MFANSRRIREIFSYLARREHRPSIFFSDQLVRTPLAFDLLNPGQRKESHQCHARFTLYLQITIRRERTATRPLGSTESPHGTE